MAADSNILSNKAYFDMFKRDFRMLIEPSNRRFLYLAIAYALAVSFLTLAVPISVQMLINTVANIASVEAIVILATVLFTLLVISGLLVALQSYILELFERRFYASMTAQFTLRNLYADQQKFRRINGNDLVNRYFDIMQVQKVLPSLIAGFFGTVLQMLVGIVLVSFYHPWLLLFNMIFVFMIWTICRVWGVRAMGTAIGLSDAKYQTARHLEDVSQSNDFYKSATRSEHAINRTNRLTSHYLEQRKKHFKNTFTQQVAFLLLYAFASAALLGLGGVLVVREELTLGQLVAAELILSAVFFAISRLSYYLIQFYDFSVALEEINRVYEIEQEKAEGQKVFDRHVKGDLLISRIISPYENHVLHLDCHIHAGEKVLIKGSHSAIQRCLSDVLKRYTNPHHGRILLHGQDIQDYKPSSLRDCVLTIDKTMIVESTILEYMKIHAPTASRADVVAALRLVELDQAIDNLPGGIETRLLANGVPLKATELLRLKLAGAILAQPSVLVLNELFDTLSTERRKRIFEYICKETDMILLYFTNRHDLDSFDRYLYIDWDRTLYVKDANELGKCEELENE
jgi:putative ABC transport system ATP-binding protein